MEDITKKEVLHSNSAISPVFNRQFGSFDSVNSDIDLELVFCYSPSEGCSLTMTEIINNLTTGRYQPLKSYQCVYQNVATVTVCTPMDHVKYTYSYNNVEGTDMKLIHVHYKTSIHDIVSSSSLPGKTFTWKADLISSYMQDLGRISGVATKNFTHQDSRLNITANYHYTKQGTCHQIYHNCQTTSLSNIYSFSAQNVNGTFYVTGNNLKKCDMFVNGRPMKQINPNNTVREGIWEFQNDYSRFSRAGNMHTITIDCNPEAEITIYHIFDTRLYFDPIGDKFDMEPVYHQKGSWFW